ncbi:MAG: DNA polymerase I [Candidatus Omnitrophica bacterium]|nr:DNA polymerase I [Candidatus Omnitrophota bacterium]
MELFIIDASYIMYRSFYAIKNFTTSTGQPTNAIYGFVSTLLKILKENDARYIIMAFDMKGPTFRHKMFEEYKITRKPMPDELSGQIPFIREIVHDFGIPIMEKEGYEADDIIASITEKFRTDVDKITIITGDKDLFQLLKPNIKILNPATWKTTDEKTFEENYGFKTINIPDFLSLTGDVSDNIPGVKGIGEKTAVKLIRQFSTIENIYENLEKITPDSVREKLISGKDFAFLSKKLLNLRKDIDIDADINSFKTDEPDKKALGEIFQKLEFKKFSAPVNEIFFEETEEFFAFGDNVYKFSDVKKEPGEFKNLCENPSILKIGKNIKEKIKFFSSDNINLSGPYFDMEIASFLTNYVSQQQDILFQWRDYCEKIKDEEVEDLFYNIEMPMIEVLFRMEERGLLLDTQYLHTLEKDFSFKVSELTEKIYAISGEVFNINSPQQLSNVLFERLKLPKSKKIKTGYSTDVNALLKLKNMHPIIPLLLEYREDTKLKTTYIDTFLAMADKKTNRIYTNFSQTSTSSGRLACYNPNLQTLPVRTEKGGMIRKAIIPPDDAFLYSFDYNQIELRILAHFSEDKFLMDAFSKNRDVHLETARILFPAQFDSIFQEENTSSLRRIAKTINFGIMYGMGSYALSEQLSCSVEEAQSFIDSYFLKFSGVKKYINDVIESAEKNGYVQTLSGRKRRIPEIKSENRNQREFGKRVAINMPVQGSASDIIKIAMLKIYDKIKKEKLKSRLILQVHDELVFEIYEKDKDVVGEIKQIMENAYTLNVPVTVDVEKGKNYLELKKI